MTLYALSDFSSETRYVWTITHRDTGEIARYEGRTLEGVRFSRGVWFGSVRAIAQDGRESGSARFHLYRTIDPDESPDDEIPACDQSCSCPDGYVCSSTSIAQCAEGASCRVFGSLLVAVAVDPIAPAVGESVGFSLDIDGVVGAAAYTWDLGDGTDAAGESPSHRYESPGTYRATLIVRDSAGNTGFASLLVHVRDSGDYDRDSIPDTEDECPRVYGTSEFFGCPRIATRDLASTAILSDSDETNTTLAVSNAETLDLDEAATASADATTLASVFPEDTCQQNRLS